MLKKLLHVFPSDLMKVKFSYESITMFLIIGKSLGKKMAQDVWACVKKNHLLINIIKIVPNSHLK